MLLRFAHVLAVGHLIGAATLILLIVFAASKEEAAPLVERRNTSEVHDAPTASPGTAMDAQTIPPQAGALGGTAHPWFQSVRARCNALEIDDAIATRPPPRDAVAEQAACLILGARAERASLILKALPRARRLVEAETLFDLLHPIVELESERTEAGEALVETAMTIVLETLPLHMEARYHAGTSAYLAHHHAAARGHFKAFLALHPDLPAQVKFARDVIAYVDSTEIERR